MTDTIKVSRTQLRPVTVLFADIVEFTPLAHAAHAESVRDLLADYFSASRAIIERYGGTVEKFIGDAVMAVWGTKIATTDDAERAVRAALELVASASSADPPLMLRVGVATGMAAVPHDGTSDTLVAGDVVTLASRVQSVATAGEVWVDTETRDASARAIDYGYRGAHALKGRRRQEQLHAADAVISERGGRGRPEVLHVPLAGYQREFATIRDTLNAAAEEHRGRLLIVTGEAGTGKSRLGLELQNYADGIEGGVRWHWTRCASLDGGTPYAALAAAVRGRLAVAESTATDLAERLDATLVEFVDDPARRAWLRSAIGILLGFDTREITREELFSAWSAWFAALAGEGDTVVWVIDDAHQADSSLLDFVQHLVATADVPLMVLLLGRPELLARRPALAAQRGTTLIGIDGLAPTAMNELLDRLVHDMPTTMRDEFATRVGNIPLFAMESVRGMLDRGEVVEHDGIRTLVATSLASMPTATLTTLITSRLDHLDALDRQVLQEASVYSDSFTASEVAALAGRSVTEVEAAFTRLASRDLIAPSRSVLASDFGRFSFLHAMVRQVAYESLTRGERARLHVSAASVLSHAPHAGEAHSGTIVEHLVLARNLDEASTMHGPDLTDWLVRAADRAIATGGFPEALRNLNLAIGSTQDPTRQSDLHLLAAEECVHLRLFDEAIAHADAIVGNDPALRLRSAIIRTKALGRMGLFDEARAVMSQWPERPDGIDDQLAAHWAIQWAHLHYLGGEVTLARPWADLAVDLAEATANPARMHQALHMFAMCYRLNGMDRIADAVNNEAAQIARDHQLTRELGVSLHNIGLSAFGQADLRRAIDSTREAVAMFNSSSPTLLLVTTMTLVRYLTMAGELDEAVERVQSVTALVGEVTEETAVELALVTQEVANLQCILGVPTDASLLALYRRLIDAETDDTRKHVLASAVLALSNGSATEDGPRGLANWLCRADLERFGAAGENTPLFWPLAIRLSIRAGEFAAGRRLISDFGRMTDLGINAHTLLVRTKMECTSWMLEALDSSSAADPAEVEQRLRATLTTLGERGFVIDHARATVALAALLARVGRIAEADQLQQEAASTLASIGALGVLHELGL